MKISVFSWTSSLCNNQTTLFFSVFGYFFISHIELKSYSICLSLYDFLKIYHNVLKFIHTITKGLNFSLFYGLIIFTYGLFIYTYIELILWSFKCFVYYLCTFSWYIDWCALRLSLCLGCGEQCCNKHGSLGVSEVEI